MTYVKWLAQSLVLSLIIVPLWQIATGVEVADLFWLTLAFVAVSMIATFPYGDPE